MAILAALLTLGSRFAGKILTTALGWASTLLFGRVPADRQFLVLGVTFGSVIWMVLVAGVLFPDVGTFLLVLVPSQDVIPESVIRLIMLIGALIVPAVVGGLTLALTGGDRSPRTVLTAIARGYPLTVLLAVLLVFLAGLGIFRKVQSVIKRWKEAHVPIVVRASAYDDVAADLEAALQAAGLEVSPRTASAAMSKPAQWLSAVAGAGSTSLVPKRLIQLDGEDLDILIYPMDLLVSGKPELVNRARAAMASRLTTTAAYLTITAEAQGIEDRLATLGRPPSDDPERRPRYDEAAATEFAAIDELLAEAPVEYEEWEVLYRMRLQVERDLRAGAMTGENVLGAEGAGDVGGLDGAVATIGRLVRGAAAAAVELAADEDTGKALDAAAGPGWRWAARVAEVAHVAARGAVSAAEPTARPEPERDPLSPDGVVSPGPPPADPAPDRDPGTTAGSRRG
jgi:hypothetical protein